ncbi:MAG: protein-export chaperone SecB [Gammaproteobacteria bacterium]
MSERKPSETKETTQTDATSSTQPNFVIQRIYIKDASIETPNTPHIFLDEWKPQMEIELQNRSQQIATDTHEVILRIMLTTKVKDKVAFMIEIQQAGIFSVHNATTEQLGPIIGSYCPSILFPYAREAIASFSMNAGFPPIHLAPVNFDAAYQQYQHNMQEDAANATDAEETQH